MVFSCDHWTWPYVKGRFWKEDISMPKLMKLLTEGEIWLQYMALKNSKHCMKNDCKVSYLQYTFSNKSVSICRSVQNYFIGLKKRETLSKLNLTEFLLAGFYCTWERCFLVSDRGGLEETICVHVPVLPIEVEHTCSTFRLLSITSPDDLPLSSHKAPLAYW